MLLLGRKTGQEIVINSNIRIKVVEIRPEWVRLGISAPKEISVHRDEIQQLVDSEKEGKDEPAVVNQ